MKFIDRQYLLRQLINFNKDILNVLYVEKVHGKGLSSNDFTDEEKQKLLLLENYDDTELRNKLDLLAEGKVDKVEGKGLSANDFTNEEKLKLNGLENYNDEEIRNEVTSLYSEIENILHELGIMKENEFFSISCENRSIKITLKNGTYSDTDISGIFSETSIEELKNVSGEGKQDGYSLTYDKTLDVWKPVKIDLEGTLNKANEYSDSLSLQDKAYADNVLKNAKSYTDGTVSEKIAEIIANAPEDLDTLKEIADWISTHAENASAMNSQINTNKSDISALKTSVAGKAEAEHTHTKSEITDLVKSLSSEDLNDFKSFGFYYSGGGNSVVNKPSGTDAFGMIVIRTASGWYTQVMYATDYGIYIRWWNGSSWTKWETEINSQLSLTSDEIDSIFV